MIGIKHFATCKCDVAAVADKNVDYELTYRFRCGKSQQNAGKSEMLKKPQNVEYHR